MADFITYQGPITDGQEITVRIFIGKSGNFVVPNLPNGETTIARRLSDPTQLEPVSAATVPAQMAAPSLVVNSASQITATLAADPANGEAAITRRDIRYSTDGATWITVTDVTSPRAISGLVASTAYSVQTRVVNSVGAGPWSVSATATTQAFTVATVAITAIGPQSVSGIPVTYSTSADVTCEAVLYLATAPAPDAADFNGGGAPTYIDLGTLALTTVGADIALAVPDELNGSYKLALLPPSGGDGDVAESPAVTIDTRTTTVATSFTDDFNSYTEGQAINVANPDYVALGTDPVPIVNASGQLRANNGLNHSAIYTGITLAANQYIEAEFPTLAFTGQGRVLGRVVDADNHYLARLNSSGNIAILRRVAGSGSNIGGTANVTLAGANKLRLEIEGDQLRAYYNEVLVLTQTDTTFTAGGQVGSSISASGTVLDNFAIGNL